jgi:hypothetical protein
MTPIARTPVLPVATSVPRALCPESAFAWRELALDDQSVTRAAKHLMLNYGWRARQDETGHRYVIISPIDF